jgi:hypothetical protein
MEANNGAGTGYAGYFSNTGTGAAYGVYSQETGTNNIGYAGYFSNSSTAGYGVYATNTSLGGTTSTGAGAAIYATTSGTGDTLYATNLGTGFAANFNGTVSVNTICVASSGCANTAGVFISNAGIVTAHPIDGVAGAALTIGILPNGGAGSALNIVGAASTGANAGGPLNLSGGNGGTTSANGGSVNLTGGNGGSTSGNSGSVNIAPGTVTSGTVGIINLQGGLSHKRTTVADAADSVLTSDYEIAYTSLTTGRAVTISCSMGTSAQPQFFIVKDEIGLAGTDNISITGTVDASTSNKISTNYGIFRYYANGTNCFTW